MREEISREVAALLDEAEKDERCLVSRTSRLSRALDARVRSGELICPAPNLYARTSTWKPLGTSEKSIQLLRGLHVLHPDWIFCGPSAAILQGMSVSHRLQDTVHLAVRRASGSRSNNLVRRHALTNLEVTEARGVPVTIPEHTAIDCARWLTFREGLAVADSALRAHGMTREQLAEQLERSRFGCTGVAQARTTVAHADPRSESGGESIARAAMWELGFAIPDLQFEVPNPFSGSGIYRVDFRWLLPDGTELYGEHDGREKYLNPLMNGGSPLQALRDERKRESRLTITHAAIMRFSPEDVRNTEFFDWLLRTYGVPKDHEPLIEIPMTPALEAPVTELVPIDAYGI